MNQVKSCSIAEKAEFRPVYILEVVRCGQVSQSKKDQYFKIAKLRILQIFTKNSIFVHIYGKCRGGEVISDKSMNYSKILEINI